jgi:FtsH-binding integral membrane protein
MADDSKPPVKTMHGWQPSAQPGQGVAPPAQPGVPVPPGYPQAGYSLAGYPQVQAPAYGPPAGDPYPDPGLQVAPNWAPPPQAPSTSSAAAYGRTAGVSPSAAAYAGSARPILGATATTGVSDRVAFIRKTYLHLLGAILLFAGLLYLLFTNEFLVIHVSAPLVKFAFGARWNWLAVIGAFMAVSWIADSWAKNATSRGPQYAGLALYVVAEALIFVPLLAIVQVHTAEILARGGHEPHILRDAAFTTLGIFLALTASVLFSKKDFSWLRSGLFVAGGAATMLVILSIVFGFNLGIVFSVAMVVLAAGYILYQTSSVLAHYDPRQHVAAALALFSSIALMFWYVIRIFLRARR